MLSRMFKKTTKQKLFIYFLKRVEGFWSRKKPANKGYEFNVHDPFEVIGEDTGYEKLYLVGDSWLEGSDKPIVIAFGFNDWKFGFIAEYLPQYRVAFAPRKQIDMKAVRLLMGLCIKPKLALIWGYNESKLLGRYLKFVGIDTWRVEDGFVRSADLGANGVTPYSLVFDSKGLYYNSNGTSDLDCLLDNYEIPISTVDEGMKLFNFFIESNISKYNPFYTKKDIEIKTKKTVLVIGQVDSDASLRYANIDNWQAEDVVRLAKMENPSAQIIYRPHPEIYKGYQNSKFESDKVKFFASIQSPDVDVIDAINKADHIYTICSLTGLEAVLRNKKVTLLGRAFYGGWGLTDDRVDYLGRNRTLTKLELFIIVYIIYPKYLCNLDDSLAGLTATIYRISSDRYIGKNVVSQKISVKDKDSLVMASSSYSWPSLLIKASKEKDDSAFTTVLSKVEIGQYYNKSSEISQKIITYFLLGLSFNEYSRNYLLNVLRNHVSSNVYYNILLELSVLGFEDELDAHWVWWLSETNNDDFALAILERNTLKSKRSKLIKNILEGSGLNNSFSEKIVTAESIDTDEKVASINSIRIDYDEFPIEQVSKAVFDMFNYQMKTRRLDGALDSCLKLLLLGFSSEDTFSKLCRLLNLLALPEELNFAAKIYKGLNVLSSNRNPIVQEMLSYQNTGFTSDEDLLNFIINLVNLKPNLIVAAKYLLHNFLNNKELLNEYLIIIDNQLNFDNDINTRKIQAYIAVERFDKAESTSLKLLNNSKSIPTLVQYSQSLSYNNKIATAINLMEDSLEITFTKLNVQELLRLYVLSSNYEKSLALIHRAERKGLQIGDMHLRKAYFGNRLLYDAFYTFTQIRITEFTKIYYKDKYIDFPQKDFDSFDKVLLLAIFGPGDEIRFASIYNSICRKFAGKEIYMSCSPRLKNLLSYSFKNITFVGVPRPRSTDLIDLNEYTKVPGSDLFQSINNDIVDVIQNVDSICYVTDMLHVVRHGYEDFRGNQYLYCSPELKLTYKEKIPKDKRIVGLSWRSSLSTTARNEHYLSVEELEPLFSIENVQFVNLQYDECDEELEWINSRYPEKIIDFEDLDQYNDFDGVAALMSCMDLIIAPATTVVELAGALGINTWLFSNSSEIDWRKINSKGTDVWHNSITIVDVPEKGNKKALSEEIYKRLVSFVET